MNVPGEIGWPLTGDCTMEFSRFPLHFVRDRVKKYGSSVFTARVLNKPTIFVTSNRGVKEILVDKGSSFKLAYKDFGYMHALYGDLVIFEEEKEALRLREVIAKLFQEGNCKMIMPQIDDLTIQKLSHLDCGPLDVYSIMKELATSICLSIFLEVTEPDKYEAIKTMATTHWHGLYAVPIGLRIKGWSSTYSRSEEAKTQLLNVIMKKLQCSRSNNSFLKNVSEASFKNEEEAANHILLFVSAVIPKALSSLVTSFVLALEGDMKAETRAKCLTEETYLEDVLLEVKRMWPAFYGGRRCAKEDVTIDGYAIPCGSHVAYITKYANRDVTTFEQPDVFLPERWQGDLVNKRDLVWTFGGGGRACIGVGFVNRVLKHVAKYLLLNYTWQVEVDQPSPVYKTLPVARPKDAVLMKFARRVPSTAPHSED